MACVAVFIDACLLKHGWIGVTVGVVAVRTGHLPLSKRHAGRTHELRLFPEMALGTDLCLSSPVKKVSLFSDLRELEAVRGLFHDGMAINAGNAAAGMGTRFPVGLKSAFVASEAGFVLDNGGFS